MYCMSIAFATPDPPLRAPGDRAAPRGWVQGGWDPAVQVDAGLGVPLGDHVTAELYAGAPVAAVAAGRPSVAVGFGPEGRWELGALQVTGAAYATARTAVDATGSWAALGSTLVARPGWGGRRWAVALEVAWSAAWATRYLPSAAAAALWGDRPGSAQQAPPSGFYWSTSHRLRVGPCAAVDLSRRWSLHGAGGVAWTPHALGRWADVPVAPLPFYAELGFGVTL